MFAFIIPQTKNFLAKFLFTCFILNMEINNNVSFGAKFINKINVGKLENKAYKQVKAAFVEIDPFNESDMFALEDIVKSWQNDRFAEDIKETAKLIFKNNTQNDIKIFALTSQQDTFEKLNPDNILGLVETEGVIPFNCHINRFQVKPDYVYKLNLEYRGIGTSILNSLKKMFNKITLISEKDKSVRNFYERNEFAEHPNGSNFYIWYKDYFSSAFKEKLTNNL